jgi:hypothetical protein
MPKIESTKREIPIRNNSTREELQSQEMPSLQHLPNAILKSLEGNKSGTVALHLLKLIPQDLLVSVEWGERPKDQIKLYSGSTPTRIDGTIHFSDAPRFKPNLTPEEVLRQGSFGGYYFRPIASNVTGKVYENVHQEFPKSWFEGLDLKFITSTVYNKNVNKYGVKCGQDLREWEEQNWIDQVDPYGWFQWYCRFYLGRRCSDDERQIQRWHNAASPSGRWRNNLLNKIQSKHGKDVKGYMDFTVSPVIRQVLHHWGYVVTEQDCRDW